MYELRDYIDENGNSRFARWFEELNAPAAARVTMALTRMEQGNFSSAKGVGGGVYESKIDFGPGYRVYYTQRGTRLLLLLAGGDKSTQQKDIQLAIKLAKNFQE